MTDAERWARVGALFDKALESPPSERQAMVHASAETADIRAEVLALLDSHEQDDGFLAPPAAPPPPAAPGTQLGAYRVIRVLGHGGMGIVYQAEDTRLQRLVALKLLSPTLAGDRHQRERLKQEARAAAALSHPNIATVFTLEEIDNEFVLVTEYLDGETLRTEIERGALPPARTLDSAATIAAALAVAHDRGIVHRDLKPENILRTRDGILKILDFGLAQFAGAARELISMTLTEAGLVAGTPPYMAPEQLLGHETDFRTDQFAFGVLLYEMAAGRHPFGARSLPSTIAKILAGQPQALQPSDRVPQALQAIIDRCLQKDPLARFPSTHELVAALDEVRASQRALAESSVHPSGHTTVAATPPEGYTVPAHASHPSQRVASVAHEAAGAANAPSTGSGPIAPALWWWRFHQAAAATIYWAMVWPVWHVHRDIGVGGLFFFFATLASVVVSANLRIHLWFSSRVYPEHLDAQRHEAGRWIRLADCVFAALLVVGGLMLSDRSAGWAALLISAGIGTTLAFLMIEPATARAAFGRR